MTLIRFFYLMSLISFFGVQELWAEETDQFTLPPTELFDIGPSTSQRLYETLEQIIAKTNTEIRTHQARAGHSRYSAKQVAVRLKDNYIANQLYTRTGPGYPRWMRGIQLPAHTQPVQFKEVRPWKTIYWLVFSQSPLFVVGLAPTINMYDYYFGTDKLGHFFMQGHTYYSIYSYCRAHGKTPQQAKATMVLYGQVLEQTYLGTLINGVYSNGDLSANYSGWKFYMNLGHQIKIGNKTLPPLLEKTGNQWRIAKHVDKNNLLKPYLTDNMNEAWNPSRHSFTRGQIRKHVKERCGEWIARKGLTQRTVEAKLKEAEGWHGENYGHWLPASNAITLNTCFGGK